MPLIHALRAVHAAIQLRHEVLREADERLHGQQHVRGEAHAAVGRGEVDGAVRELVVLDDQEAGDEGVGGEEDEREVGEGAAALLGRGVGRLQDQDGLRGEQDAGRVEQRVPGEEGERVQEDAGPDEAEKDEDADLGDEGGAWGRVSWVVYGSWVVRNGTNL